MLGALSIVRLGYPGSILPTPQNARTISNCERNVKHVASLRIAETFFQARACKELEGGTVWFRERNTVGEIRPRGSRRLALHRIAWKRQVDHAPFYTDTDS